jgi:hypothetical protein
MATVPDTAGLTAQLEDTYRIGDSDAENDDADQVGRDIDEFEARLRGDAPAVRAGAAQAAARKVSAKAHARRARDALQPAAAFAGPHARR